MEELILFIEKYVPLETSLITKLLEGGKVEKFKKGTFLLSEGQICQKKWFIKKGLAKAFFITNDGTQKIIGFHLEGTLMTQLDSYEQGNSSDIYIQAIESLEVITLPKRLEIQLLQHPEYVKFKYLLYKEMLLEAYQIQRQINTLDGKARYLFLMEYFPSILHQVKLKDIANFIGISQERLSRIRQSIS
jgi:CRP-like cAMP-binding protein